MSKLVSSKEMAAALAAWEDMAGRWKLSVHGNRHVVQWDFRPMEEMPTGEDPRQFVHVFDAAEEAKAFKLHKLMTAALEAAAAARAVS